MKQNIKDDNIQIFVIRVMYIFFLLAILILGIIVSVLMVYAQTNIIPGECYIDNSTNSTYCANNSSKVELNLTLYPGDIKNYQNTTYNVSAQCIANATASNKCIVEKILEPGESYNQQSALCDLKIEVKEANVTNTCNTATTTYSREYKVRYSNQSQRIQFNFAEQERIWNIDDNIDITGKMDFQCPLNVVGGNGTVSLLAEQCKAVVPLYCNELASMMIMRFDTCETKRAEYESKLEDCRRADVNKVTLLPEELAQIQSENLALLNQTEQAGYKIGQYEKEISDLKNDRTALSIFSLVLIAICLALYFNPKMFNKTSSIGGA